MLFYFIFNRLYMLYKVDYCSMYIRLVDSSETVNLAPEFVFLLTISSTPIGLDQKKKYTYLAI